MTGLTSYAVFSKLIFNDNYNSNTATFMLTLVSCSVHSSWQSSGSYGWCLSDYVTRYWQSETSQAVLAGDMSVSYKRNCSVVYTFCFLYLHSVWDKFYFLLYFEFAAAKIYWSYVIFFCSLFFLYLFLTARQHSLLCRALS